MAQIQDETVESVKTAFWLTGISVVALIVMLLIGGSPVFNVGPGEKAAKYSRSDGVQEHNYEEGLHFMIPIWESAEIFDVREQTFVIKTSSPTNERQEIFVTALVTWHINRSEVWQYHKFIGENTAMEKLKDSTETEVKAATVQRTVHKNLLDRQQNKMENEIEKSLSVEMNEFYITVTDVDIPNIEPSEEWITANEAKVIAKEKAIEERHLEKAELARHNQTVIKAQADAKSIELVREELPQGSGYNEYLTIRKWDGVLPNVVASGGEGSVMDLLVPTPQSDIVANQTAS